MCLIDSGSRVNHDIVVDMGRPFTHALHILHLMIELALKALNISSVVDIDEADVGAVQVGQKA